MLTIVTVFAFLALANAAVLPKLTPRIVNGDDALPGEIPYQVSLQYKGTKVHFCGGSVVNAFYVITAAHCLEGESVDGVVVVAGVTDLKTAKVFHNVEKFIMHENYDPSNSWKNDIALMKLASPIYESKTIKFVTLPSKQDVVKDNDHAVVSGWGKLSQFGKTSRKLQRVDIYISSQDYCKNVYQADKELEMPIHDSQICAHDRTAERGSCQADSGGPLTVNGKLVGLVSWARGCASTVFPTVFTRVSSYLDWIEQHSLY